MVTLRYKVRLVMVETMKSQPNHFMNPTPASFPAGNGPTKPPTKSSFARAGWVLAGYALALLLAGAVVAGNSLLFGNSKDQASSGMTAFGDVLLFLAVFAAASTLPTCLALFFMRSHRAFWPALAALALAFSVTGTVAFLAWFMNPLSLAASLGFMRILLAPLAALFFLLGGLFAPRRGPKASLFSAAAVEVMVFGGWLVTCLLRNR